MDSVALVVLDTLRKDAFGRYFDWLPGRRFERAHSTANWTVPAHASLFTGRYASEVGIHAKNMYFDCDEPSIAERLRDAGYATRAFSANTNVTGHFDFDRGFVDFRTPAQFDHLVDDDLFDWREFSRRTDATGKARYLRAVYECIRSDVDMLRSLYTGVRLKRQSGTGVEYGGAKEALAEIEDMNFGDREFLFLNLMEAHEPYVAPDEYSTDDDPPMPESVGDISVGSVEGERIERAYDACAAYLSDAYRDLFETLHEEFDYVITLSDHGEMLGEDGSWGHEHGIHPTLTHVPLVVSGEGLDGVVTDPVGLVDVHATVLDAAGLSNEVGGESLLGDVEGGERLAEYLGLTSWSERKLESNGYGDEIEAYDRELRGVATDSGCYGFETVDGFDSVGPCDEDDLADELARVKDRLDVRDVETDNEVPNEVKDRLEDLGYA